MYRTALLLLLPLLSACDFGGGVFRGTILDFALDHQCIEIALGRVDEVTEVRYARRVGSKTWTLTGQPVEPPELHDFYYDAFGVDGYILLSVNEKNETGFNHAYGGMHFVPSQAEANKIRPIMAKVEKAVESSCNIPGFRAYIRETCYRVECPPPPET